MKMYSIATALLLMAVLSCKKDSSNSQTESASLSSQEISDLKFLREEEKLARDVYMYNYNKYGSQVFSNIASSEQTHLDQVGNLLTRYGIPDPAAGQEAGKFTNSELQAVYNQLIITSDSSLNHALFTGALIEDMDIKDIRSFFSHTSKTDLSSVYDLLTCGSRNHIRSYTSQLKNSGVTYKPVYLSDSEYTEILSGGHEACGQMKRGW